MDLSDLNELQRAAVTHDEGPLLVVAGVGTGKTTVITRRIAWLISEKRAEPEEILALTFTEKAAAEMEERVDRLVPYGYVEAHIGTFHAFCDRLLRENAVLLGLPPDYRILTEPEQALFLKEHLFDLPLKRFRPLGNPLQNLRSLLSLFSRAKDEDASSGDYKAYVERLAHDSPPALEDAARLAADSLADQTELAETYAAYDRLLHKHGFVDFGDLIALALRLLREHPAVLARSRERFRHILVDEFQDTNYAQFELVKLLASHRNVTACGDDDQSIYKFRGAAISNILGFQSAYPDGRVIVLHENYRSTQAILDSAYRLIQNNNPDRLEVRAGISKRLHATSGVGHAPHQLHFETLDEETDFVAETIDKRRREEDRPCADFAVLVRSNSQATPFLSALNLLKIPWRFSGSRGLYDQEEIRAVLAFLRVLADPYDNMSLHYLASSLFYNVDPEPLARATALAGRRNKSLLDVLRSMRAGLEPSEADEENARRLARLVDDVTAMVSLSTKERTGEVLFQFLTTQTGTIERLSNSGEAQDALRIQNLARLFSLIERFSHVARYDRVPWFIDYLDALIDAGDNPPVGDAAWDTDAVSVLTIHQAKGLEFPIVFLVGLVAGRFPSTHRADPIPLPDALVKDLVSSADFHKQEERRLFYVGMTRAKEDLYLTSAQEYGGKRPRKPSLFVSEALDLDASQLAPQARQPLTPILRHERARRAEEPEEPVVEPTLVDRGEEALALSYRQVDDYLSCPLKYRYIHVLHVPVRQHHSLVYGSAIHQAVRFYNLQRHAGRDATIDELHAIFRSQWLAEGFLTRQHEELRLQEGLEALRRFLAFESAERSTPTYVERRFSVPVGSVRLVGIFDRIDIAGDAGRIIDYKTSAVLTQAEADKRAADSLQLAIYALAYEKLFDGPPQAVELRFLTPDVLVGRAVPSPKRAEHAQSEIERTAAGIRAARFPGDPEYRACNYCSYAGICPSRRLD
jgi:DNA helicase-2/ATP-dependent DNA helicase PcrA